MLWATSAVLLMYCGLKYCGLKYCGLKYCAPQVMWSQVLWSQVYCGPQLPPIRPTVGLK